MHCYSKLKHSFQDKVIRLNETLHFSPAQNTQQFCGTAALTLPIIGEKSLRKAEFLGQLHVLLWSHMELIFRLSKQVQVCEITQKEQKILRFQLLHEQPLTDGSHLWRLQYGNPVISS